MSHDPSNSVAEINHWIEIALGTGEAATRAQAQIQQRLKLDELNWIYFFYLFRGRRHQGTRKPLRIFEANQPGAGQRTAYPLGIAPAHLKAHVRDVQYADLVSSSERYDETARTAALWVKKMQAGSGSSMTRTSYLARKHGKEESQVKIGAKGTDLHIGNPEISLAEAQILQSIGDQRRGEVGEIIFHDIVSSETDDAIEQLWQKPSLIDRTRSYHELVNTTPGLARFRATFQAFVPTLDSADKISFNRQAPAGHALFAVDALRAAYREDLRPQTTRPLVAAISNGEDLSSGPDRFMIGYLVKERVPIALVTTERTAVDLKGGLVSLVVDEADGSGQTHAAVGPSPSISLTVLETAQAHEAGQGALFASLPGAINTNLALFNYEVLAPLITREVAEIGEAEFLKIISPDLISNVKEQKDADGVSRKYLQLEGAMGSTLMNLDRHWRRKYGEPLVHLINVARDRRTDFFSPIKSAFDFFMQFHSDRFAFDTEAMRLRNLRPGELPQVSLRDSASGDRYYQDVETVLGAFQGVSIKDLDVLDISGAVRLVGCTLRGKVQIHSLANGVTDIGALLVKSGHSLVLENVALDIDVKGRLTRRAL